MRLRLRRLPFDGQGRRGRAGLVPAAVTRATVQMEDIPAPETPHEATTEARPEPLAHAPPSLTRAVATAVGVADAVRRVTVPVPEVTAAREAVPRPSVGVVCGTVPAATVVRGRVAPTGRTQTNARLAEVAGSLAQGSFLAPRRLVGLVAANDT